MADNRKYWLWKLNPKNKEKLELYNKKRKELYLAGKRQAENQPSVAKKSMEEHVQSKTPMASGSNQATDDMDTDMVNDSTSKSSSGMAGNRGSAGMRGTVQMPDGVRIAPSTCLQEYTKDYSIRIQAKGIDYCTYSNTTTNGDTETYAIRYPYNNIPVQMLGLYLTKDEIVKIINECTYAKVVKCEVDVYTHQAQLPFETGSTTSTLVNNNVGIYISQIDPAFQECTWWNVETPFEDTVESTFWGTPFTNLATTNGNFSEDNVGSLSAQYVLRNYQNRAIYYSTKQGGTIKDNTVTGGFSSYYEEPAAIINRYKINRRNASFNEGHYIKWEYEPKSGIFHNQSFNGYNISAGNNGEIHTGISATKGMDGLFQQNSTDVQGRILKPSFNADYAPLNNPSIGEYNLTGSISSTLNIPIKNYRIETHPNNDKKNSNVMFWN